MCIRDRYNKLRYATRYTQYAVPHPTSTLRKLNMARNTCGKLRTYLRGLIKYVLYVIIFLTYSNRLENINKLQLYIRCYKRNHPLKCNVKYERIDYPCIVEIFLITMWIYFVLWQGYALEVYNVETLDVALEYAFNIDKTW